MTGLEEYEDEVRNVCSVVGVEPEVVMELLALEPLHQSLHAWGAKPALRRRIAAIVDGALARRATAR